MKDDYYSIRTGLKSNTKPALEQLKLLFTKIFKNFEDKGYWQEYFGYICVDKGYVEGKLGSRDETDAYLSFKLGQHEGNEFFPTVYWPLISNIKDYDENDLFDIIEFLHDHISEPFDGFYHEYNRCGWHSYSRFEPDKAKQEYRNEVNVILAKYKEGYELTDKGLVMSLTQEGYKNLINAEIPTEDEKNIKSKVEHAIHNFRRARNEHQQLDAIITLANILELLRPEVKIHSLSKDENKLFDIINNFEIRHHNSKQHAEYDKPIFYRWMFYYFLATIHAILRLIEKYKK